MLRLVPFLLHVLAFLALLFSPAYAQFGGVLAEPTPVPKLKPSSDNKALTSFYRGDTENIIARTPWGALTEAQFYCYLLTTQPNDADICDTWRKAPEGKAREAARKKIETALREWARTLALSNDHRAEEPRDDVERLRFYTMVYPIHELVWIDRHLVPQVRVLSADVKKYYDEHPELTEPPRRARCRFLMIRVGKGEADPVTETARAPEAEWQTAESRMREILDEVHLGNLSFEEAVRAHSEASNAPAGGLVDDFAPGTYFGEFEKRAFLLKPDQIGAPFRGPQGVYVIQGLVAKPRPPLTIDDVRGKIEDILKLRQIQSRYVFEMEKLREKARVIINALRLDDIVPGARAFKVGRIDLTRDELWNALPDFINPEFELELANLWGRCNHLAGLELIARFNTRRGWGEDPRLRWARDMANHRLAARDRLDTLVRPLLRKTPRQVADYVREHPKGFTELTKPRATLIEVALSDEGAKLGIPHRAWHLKRMRETMENACDAVTSVSLATLARTWPQNGDRAWDLAPLSVERKLLLEADENVTVSRLSSDSIDKKTNAVWRGLLEGALERIRNGAIPAGTRFLPIEGDERSVRIVYVEQPDFSQPDIAEQQWFDLYEKAARAIRSDVVDTIEKGLVDSGKLEIPLTTPRAKAER